MEDRAIVSDVVNVLNTIKPRERRSKLASRYFLKNSSFSG